MTKKTSIKTYEPKFLAEYVINNQNRVINLPVKSVQDMKELRKMIRQEKMDLELDDQIIKGSRLIRFFKEQPANDFEYFIGKIPDEDIRERFIVLRKQRRQAGQIAPIKILRRMYQRTYLKRNDETIIDCDDADGIIKLLEPFYRE